MDASKTPLSDAAIENHWDSFNEEIHHFVADTALPHLAGLRAKALARIEMGGRTYGDKIFHYSEERILQEAMDEQLDEFNYAFFGWSRFGDSLYLTIAAHAANGYAKCAAMAEFKASLQPRSLNCIPTRP